jgi:hypothetical protein
MMSQQSTDADDLDQFRAAKVLHGDQMSFLRTLLTGNEHGDFPWNLPSMGLDGGGHP